MRSRSPRVLLLATCAVLAGLGSEASASSAEPARPADALVDSIGVNVHMTYGDTAYRDRDRLVAKLAQAGIRHVRDGLSYDTEYAYRTFDQLADRGIRTTFILGDPTERRDTLDQLLTTLRTRVRRAAEAVEGPNEYSHSGDPQWVPRLREYQGRLNARIKQDPALVSLPVLAPSLITWQDHEALGDLTGALDAGNKHSYPGGDVPESNMDTELAVAAKVSGTKPIYVTESGYHNATATGGGHRPASEAAVGTYLPRMFLEYFRRGVVRTFSYELIDGWPDPARTNQEANFGLLRNDYSEKPAYRSLSNLIALLSDPGPAFTPAPLTYKVTGAPSDLRRLVLQKRDGSHHLVLWRAARVWDPVARRAVTPGVAEVSVDLSSAGGPVEVFKPVESTEAVASIRATSAVRVGLGADPIILRIPPGDGTLPVQPVPGDVAPGQPCACGAAPGAPTPPPAPTSTSTSTSTSVPQDAPASASAQAPVWIPAPAPGAAGRAATPVPVPAVATARRDRTVRIQLCATAKGRLKAALGIRVSRPDGGRKRFRRLATAHAIRRSRCRVDVVLPDRARSAGRAAARPLVLRLSHRPTPRSRWRVVEQPVTAIVDRR